MAGTLDELLHALRAVGPNADIDPLEDAIEELIAADPGALRDILTDSPRIARRIRQTDA